MGTSVVGIGILRRVVGRGTEHIATRPRRDHDMFNATIACGSCDALVDHSNNIGGCADQMKGMGLEENTG